MTEGLRLCVFSGATCGSLCGRRHHPLAHESCPAHSLPANMYNTHNAPGTILSAVDLDAPDSNRMLVDTLMQAKRRPVILHNGEHHRTAVKTAGTAKITRFALVLPFLCAAARAENLHCIGDYPTACTSGQLTANPSSKYLVAWVTKHCSSRVQLDNPSAVGQTHWHCTMDTDWAAKSSPQHVPGNAHQSPETLADASLD